MWVYKLNVFTILTVLYQDVSVLRILQILRMSKYKKSYITHGVCFHYIELEERTTTIYLHWSMHYALLNISVSICLVKIISVYHLNN